MALANPLAAGLVGWRRSRVPGATTSVSGRVRTPAGAVSRRPISASTRAGSAPLRSILLMKISVGTARRRRARQRRNGLRLGSLHRGDDEDMRRVEHGQAPARPRR